MALGMQGSRAPTCGPLNDLGCPPLPYGSTNGYPCGYPHMDIIYMEIHMGIPVPPATLANQNLQ